MKLNKRTQSMTVAGLSDCKINVLEVIGNASVGGMENYIKNFIANLPDDQFRVTCICPYESLFTDSLRQLGVEDVFITPIEDDPTWHAIQLAVEVARLHQIDVLHAHMPKAHVLGITRAVRSHLITNCQEAYTQALAMGVSSERVCLIRNGVDIEVFTPG